jgi:hypothetical protein
MNENLKRILPAGAAALVVAVVLPFSAMSSSGSTAASFAFGRVGGNIEPFTVTIAADGSVLANGPAQPSKRKVGAADLARVTRVVVAQRFFSLPRSTSCPKTLPDFASRFVTVHLHGVSRRVVVHGECSSRFNAVYAALAKAVGI